MSDSQSLSPLKRALLAIDEMKARLDAAEGRRSEPIAIVGMGCRVPGAANLDAFWALLREGRSSVRQVPADRWDIGEYYSPDASERGRMNTRLGAFLDRIDMFEPAFFGIAPREAVSMDPQQRLVLEVAWEALEHAGIAPDGLEGSATGVYVGVAANDYADLMKTQGDAFLDGHFASGIAHSVISGRLSYLLGLQGPSLSVDTACSSSLVATHLACQALRAGDCRMAIAAGVNVIAVPDNSIVFSKSGMLAPDGRCKTFDAAADGFVRGEGCGVVVLKRLSDARRDGDRILGVIRGTAVNQDGASSSLTAPNGPSQEAVMRAALERAGLRPEDVDYVEAHGTGTPLGDPIEAQAIGAVHASRPKETPVLVGSLKTNVGHLETAAGIAALIKVVLALQHEEIPAHLNLSRPSPHIAWDELPIAVVTARRPWPGGRPRRAGVSSFGFSGTNAHVVVEEAPADVSSRATGPDRQVHVVALSARTESALATRARDLGHALEAADLDVPDVAFTQNTGRAHLRWRAAIVADSRASLISQLAALAERRPAAGLHAGADVVTEPPRVAFLFTGQGAQYVDMGRQLAEREPVFRQAVEACDAILTPQLGRSLRDVMWPSDGAASPVDQTAWTQPALFTIDFAIASLWRSWGIEPSVVMGHSLGEYVAACVAGILSLEDALTLVAARGRLMQQLPAGGGMVSVFAPAADLADVLRGHEARLAIAAINEPSQTVVSGDQAALASFIEAVTARGIRTKPLTVSHAFHSPLMKPMLGAFEAVLRGVTFSTPRLSIVSNVTGRPVSGDAMSRSEYWLDHVLAPVRFADSVAALLETGVQICVESGPAPTLLAMARRCVPDETAVAWLPSLRKGRDDNAVMLEALAQLYVRGARVNWRAFDADRERTRLALPTYPFERERFWVDTRSRRQATASHALHPLLARRVRAAGLDDLVFETIPAHERHLSWIFEHRVQGVVIAPGAAVVEMGFEAARARWGEGLHTVEDLVLHRALVVDEGRITTWQIVVHDLADGRAAFRVHSAPDEEASWTLHAEGVVVRAGDAAPLLTPDVVGSPVREDGTASSPAAYYEELAARGIELGRTFRGLVTLGRSGDSTYADIALPEDTGVPRYVVHPVLMDLGIQALGPTLDLERGTAFLPVAVKAVRRYGNDRAVRANTSVRRESAGDDVVADVFLRAADGRLVVGLEGVRLKRVDRDALARQQSGAVAGWLYDIDWQPAVSGARTPIARWLPSLAAIGDGVASQLDVIAREQQLAAYGKGLAELETLSTAYVHDAIVALRGEPLTPGARLDAATLAAAGHVVPAQRRLLGRFLEMLGEAGLLRRDGDGWVATRNGSVPDEDRKAWWTRLERQYRDLLEPEFTLAGRCGPELAAVLRGADPVALLFPGGSADVAERLYQVSPISRAFNQLLARAVDELLAALPVSRPIRILEIGGGTGATSSFLLPALRARAVAYVFTDVSPAFTARARTKFAAFPFVEYRTLDIERNPSDQGFDGRTFDLIVAANVLHATRSLGETFAHVRQLLAPGGVLVMLETVTRQRWIDITFGLTDGWWRFTDTELRPGYPLLTPDGWQEFLEAAGFQRVVAVPGSARPDELGLERVIVASGPARREGLQDAAGHWLIVGDTVDAQAVARAVTARGGLCTIAPMDRAREAAATFVAGSAPLRGVVHMALGAGAEWTSGIEARRAATAQVGRSALDVLQVLAGAGQAVPVTFVTRGARCVQAGDTPVAEQATVWGMAMVAALEHPELVCRRIDLDPAEDAVALLVDDLVEGTPEDQVAYRGGCAHVPRLVSRPAAPARRDGEGAARVRIERPGSFDSLALDAWVRRQPGPGEVELRVHMAALNFRDVMNVLGLYPGDPGPLGNECVGEVVAVGPGVEHLRVGDQAVGLAPASLATHATAPAAFLVRRPETLTAADAATIPIPYITAAFALHTLGRIGAGHRVLIHAAAGGVGLAAVYLAQRAGAEVFATAGSPAKRAFLESLGVRHVMSSRSAAFGDEIAALTEGRGVDIVLNSLAGDLIAPGFQALAPGGTFLEIGKRGWSAERVAALGRDVRYHVIDWSDEMRDDPALIRSILTDVVERAGAGELPPLPRTVFPLAGATDAFRFMAQARHTGRVLLDAGGQGATVPRADGTYLITGGLSGLGLLVADWLVRRGARHLVLMGRSDASVEARATIDALEQRGARVSMVRGDVSIEADVRAALTRIDLAAPLRGVIHSAGVLDDGVIVQQQWPRFEKVLDPKLTGVWNLDRLTRSHGLDFFVLFSSVAAVFGARGQANHSAANAGMDAVVHARRSLGLPAQTINWGVWSEIGAAVAHGVDRTAAARGIGTIDPARGLVALEGILEGGAAQTIVFPVDWTRYAAAFDGRVPPLLSSVTSGTSSGRDEAGESAAPDTRATLLDALEQVPHERRRRVILDHVRQCAGRVLGLPSSRVVEARQPLQEVGLDSLMAVELRNVLGTSVDRLLPATLLFDYPTADALTDYLAALLSPSDDGGAPRQAVETPAPSVVDDIHALSDEEVDRLLAGRLAGKQQT